MEKIDYKFTLKVEASYDGNEEEVIQVSAPTLELLQEKFRLVEEEIKNYEGVMESEQERLADNALEHEAEMRGEENNPTGL